MAFTGETGTTLAVGLSLMLESDGNNNNVPLTGAQNELEIGRRTVDVNNEEVS